MFRRGPQTLITARVGGVSLGQTFARTSVRLDGPTKAWREQRSPIAALIPLALGRLLSNIGSSDPPLTVATVALFEQAAASILAGEGTARDFRARHLKVNPSDVGGVIRAEVGDMIKMSPQLEERELETVFTAQLVRNREPSAEPWARIRMPVDEYGPQRTYWGLMPLIEHTARSAAYGEVVRPAVIATAELCRFWRDDVSDEAWDSMELMSALQVAIGRIALADDPEATCREFRFQGLAAELADASAAELARTDVLLDASDRLDDHLDDGPFDDYFKLILLACSAAAYGSLQRFREHVRADEEASDAGRLVGLFDEPAAADRAVRTATWMLLCAVIAERWRDRWQEVVDLASTAMPLDPAGLAAAARQIELHAEWQAAPDESDELRPETSGPIAHAYTWLATAVTQQPQSSTTLDVAALGWGTELIHGFARYYEHLTELEERNPDAVPTD